MGSSDCKLLLINNIIWHGRSSLLLQRLDRCALTFDGHVRRICKCKMFIQISSFCSGVNLQCLFFFYKTFLLCWFFPHFSKYFHVHKSTLQKTYNLLPDESGFRKGGWVVVDTFKFIFLSLKLISHSLYLNRAHRQHRLLWQVDQCDNWRCLNESLF